MSTNAAWITFIPMKNDREFIGPASMVCMVKSWEEIVQKMEMWMICCAKEKNLDEFIGAYFYIEEKNINKQYIIINGGGMTQYFPVKSSIVHPTLKYKDKKIDKYVRDQPESKEQAYSVWKL